MKILDRKLSGGLFKQLATLVVFVLTIFVVLVLFSCIVLRSSAIEIPTSAGGASTPTTSMPIAWWVYYHFVDPDNQHLVNNQGQRVLAFFISIVGMVLVTGLLISTFSNIMERRVERVREGQVYYRWNNHIVLLGFDNMVPCLVRQICHKYTRGDIVLLTSGKVDDVRMKLQSELTPCQFRRVDIVYGNRNAVDTLQKLRLHRAKEFFVLGEQNSYGMEEYAHDSLNIDCLTKIDECIARSRTTPALKLRCNLLIEYQTAFTVLQTSDLKLENLTLAPFNYYETWAQKVLVMGHNATDEIKYPPLDREPLSYDSTKRIHLVIVGMSRMGVAMAIEAAHVAHFPNFVRDKSRKTLITFIDANMEENMTSFKNRFAALFDQSHSTYIDAATDEIQRVQQTPSKAYAHLGKEENDYKDYIDIEWQFVNGRIESPAVRKLIEQWCCKDDDVLTMAICFNLQNESLAAALYLPDAVSDHGVPVLVFQRESATMVEMISGKHKKSLRDNKVYNRKKPFATLLPFGMESECIDLSTNSELYARRVNYVYYYYSSVERKAPVTLPEVEVKEKWNEMTKTVKIWSNIYNANTLPTKLRSIGYSWEKRNDLPASLGDKVVDILARVEHNRWNVEQLLLGFRPVTKEEQDTIDNDRAQKEVMKKVLIHYDIRPYDDLREDSKGILASEYDIALTESLPLIVKD